MNRVRKGVFLVRKGSYTTFNIVNIRKIWEKKGKIRKTWSMTKKRSSEILAVKMEFFQKKTSLQKSWAAKKLSVPPNSAPGLRHCRGFYLISPGGHGDAPICLSPVTSSYRPDHLRYLYT